MSEVDQITKKFNVAAYTLILYGSTVVFGHITDLRTAANISEKLETPRGNWVLSAGVVGTCISALMLLLWFVVPGIAKKINVFASFFLTAWWSAGVAIAVQLEENEVLVGLSFVPSVAAALMFMFDIHALCEAFKATPAAKAVADEEAPTSDAARTELVEQQASQNPPQTTS